MKVYTFTKEQITEAFNKAKTAIGAARELGVQYCTYRRVALLHGVFQTNKPGKGASKKRPMVDLDEILSGLHPDYHGYKLKHRLFQVGLKKAECEECGWCRKTSDGHTPVELDHINGNRYDHRLENLRILCPNCHSMTDTYRSRRRKP